MTMLLKEINQVGGYILAGYAIACLGFRFSTFEEVRWFHDVLGCAIGVAAVNGLIIGSWDVPEPLVSLAIIGSIYKIWASQIRGPLPVQTLDVKDKIVIVTGSNSGIGIETARNLAARGARVIMACRTKATAESVQRAIITSTGNQHVDIMDLDLCRFASIRKFVEDFGNKYGKVDILVNNAGVLLTKRMETDEGLEMSMQVNCISLYLLTVMMIPLLRKSTLPQGGRIVNVSSSTHKYACKFNNGFDFQDMFHKQGFSTASAYGQSKLGAELFMLELNKRLRQKGDKVQVNSLHPGSISTNISRHFPWILHVLQPYVIGPLNKTLVSGAYTTLHVATNAELSKVSGCYFEHCTSWPRHEKAKDTQAAARLWSICENLTGFPSAEVGL